MSVTSGAVTTYHNDISLQSTYKPELNRYHIFTAKSCPFAHCVEITRRLKGLVDNISITFCNPVFNFEKGWQLNYSYQSNENVLNHVPKGDLTSLNELYKYVDSDYIGRMTIQLIFDKWTNTIVNNESSQIIKILNSSFNTLIDNDLDLYPPHLQNQINQFRIEFNDKISTGTYKAGHAKTNDDYALHFNNTFEYLDKLDDMLKKNNTLFLVGDNITLADIHAFPHLIRFDAVFYTLFSLNKKHLWEYENIHAYLKRLCSIKAFVDCTDIDEIKKGAFLSENNLAHNLGAKVPLGNGGIEKYFKKM